MPRIVGVALVVLAVFGCARQCYLTDEDFKDAHDRVIPPNLDCDTELVAIPSRGTVPPPTTVDDTKREVRYLSLREAIAIALENGNVGAQSPGTPGFVIDTLVSFAGITATSADAIRVLAIDPAITTNNIELSLAKFDTLWTMSALWGQTQTPLGITPTTFLQSNTSLLPNVSAQTFNYTTGLEKPLPTGGVAGITFGVSSAFNSPPSFINPAIQPSLQFQFEQPLLQGFGIEINQLRDNHPGSILNPFSLTNTGEGILIARVRSNEQRAQFESNLNYLLLNVEAAYWNLYGAYYQLYAREEAMRYSFESWRLTKLLLGAGRAAEQDVEQTRVQYESFRAQRLTALGQVLESERQLRGLLGLKLEDGLRFVPTETPVLTPFKPDWRTALDDALARRPELTIARQDLKFRQFDLIRQRNTLLPDLRLVATDTIHSVGSRIDGGPEPQNAFHQLVSDPFDNYSVGLVMNVPLGYRAANESVRNAQLNLKRSYLSLRAEEDKAERFLGLAYRQIFEFQNQIQINQAELKAASIQLERKFDLIKLGRAPAFGADLILAEQSWSTAASNLYSAVVQYNNALATFDFARGAIQERDSVYLGEGALPRCAYTRAVEHERQRTQAIVLAERSTHPSHLQAGLSPDAQHVPMVPLDPTTPLPTLMENSTPLPQLGDSSGGGIVNPLSQDPVHGTQAREPNQLPN
jgi:outer membrane protein TolC